MELLQTIANGESMMAFLALLALSMVCFGTRRTQISSAATLTLVMALVVGLASLIVAFADRAFSHDLRDAISFSVLLVVYASTFKLVLGVIFGLCLWIGHWRHFHGSSDTSIATTEKSG